MGRYYHKSIENIDIKDVCYDSREVVRDSVFVCIKGERDDGHRYASAAVRGGAVIVVAEKIVSCGGSIILVDDTKAVLKELIKKFYGVPRVKLIGITGTNGKTTVSHMVAAILEKSGIKSGVIGTNGVYVGGREYICRQNTPTTPNQLELYKTLTDMEKQGVEYCAMEVSSHALDQDRVYGLSFDVAAFTNLTRDHLDYHSDMESYFSAKRKLFDITAHTVTNADDEYGRRLLAEENVISYGIKSGDIRAEGLALSAGGIGFELLLDGKRIHQHINITGIFSVYNALTAAAVCRSIGISEEYICEGLASIKGIDGRMEHVGFGDVDVIIDYAHTPDGLQKVLETLRRVTDGRIICLFGCGGERDRSKRAAMGEIAVELADIAVITSDNPRGELPTGIIIDILQGVKKDNYIVIENREKAIKAALQMAKKGDTVLLAGKGQEKYQIIGNEKKYFNERDIVKGVYKTQNGEKNEGVYC